MADSYKIKLKIQSSIGETTSEFDQKNTACFSQFNNKIIENKNNILNAYIIIEGNKIDTNGKEFSDKYLQYIKELEIIPFDIIIQDNGDYYLDLHINKIKNKSHLQYTGMIVRCLYEPNVIDKFQEIAKYFVELYDYFPDLDKCKLFTIACNLYLMNIKSIKNDNGYPGFNSNHILMFSKGCKILNKEQVIDIIEKNTGINHNFTVDENIKNPEIYRLKSRDKEDYEKIIKSEY